MTNKQFRAALLKLGLTQMGTARLLGVNAMTVRRWVSHGPTGLAVILVQLMLDDKIGVADIEAARKRGG
jgi:hypothetical protein